MNLKFCYKFYLVSFIIISANLVQAQVSKFSGWSALVSTIKINPSVNIIFDAQIRSADQWREIETTIIRPGLSFRLNKKSSLSFGLALVNNHKIVAGVEDMVADNRAWQQWLLNQPLRVNSLQHRIRLEERSIPTIYAAGNELKKKDAKFNTRLRYFNRYASGFTKKGKLEKGPYWVIQNELFFNAIGSQFANGKLFDQSRTSVGGGWRFSSNLDIEMGYMLQYVEGRGKAFTNSHVLQLTSFLRL
jgi:hypothetical protein